MEEIVREQGGREEPATETQPVRKGYEKPLVTVFEGLKTVTGSVPS